MPSVTKVNVVFPSMGTGFLAWCVTMKTGVWNGGLSPHQPFHGSSPHEPLPPTMFRPITVAPIFSSDSSMTSVEALTSPPSRPWGPRQAASPKTHSCNFIPPSPSGFSLLWFGPATKPSSDIEMCNLSLDTAPLS